MTDKNDKGIPQQCYINLQSEKYTCESQSSNLNAIKIYSLTKNQSQRCLQNILYSNFISNVIRGVINQKMTQNDKLWGKGSWKVNKVYFMITRNEDKLKTKGDLKMMKHVQNKSIFLNSTTFVVVFYIKSVLVRMLAIFATVDQVEAGNLDTFISFYVW